MNLLLKYMKSNYQVEDFGRGKTSVAKQRHRRAIKRKAKSRFLKDDNRKYNSDAIK